MSRRRPVQVKIPSTLPPLRHAEAEMWRAWAEREEWQLAVDEAADKLAADREGLKQAEQTLSGAMRVLHEVRDAAENRQEPLPEDDDP